MRSALFAYRRAHVVVVWALGASASPTLAQQAPADVQPPAATSDAGVPERPDAAQPAAAAPRLPEAAPEPAAPPPARTDQQVRAPEAVVQPPGTGLFEARPEAEPTAAPQGTTAKPATAEPREPPSVELGGYVRGDLFVGKVPGFDQGLVQAGYGELALKLDARAVEHGDAHAELRSRYGQQGKEHDLLFELREAYVDVFAGPVDVRVGQQLIVWGRADAFNPTNVLMPIDLRIRSPIEDDRRVGNVGVRAFVQVAPPVRIEGVWLPLYRPTEYPPLELDPYITLTEPDYPEPELANGLGAGRVHLELAAFEASLSYVHGHAPLPGLALRDFTVGEDPPEVRIARTAYEHDVIGADFSTAVGELLAIRGEAAFRRPAGYETRVYAPRPDVQYVLGVDRAFGPVSVILQYMGRVVLDWQREDGPEDPIEPATLARFMPPLPRSLERSITTSIEEELAARNQVLFAQTARVQQLASARVEWTTLHDTLSLSALGMVNFTTQEWLAFPKLGYRISDAMTLYAGAEIYSGPADTLLDLIDEQLSAGYAELRYAF